MSITYLKNNVLQCKRFAQQQNRVGRKLLANVLEIPFVEYAVTTRCTLRCKKCSNLIPEFKSKTDISLERAKREISRFLEYVDYVYRFKIHGGEPFLYPCLPELLDWLSSNDKIGEIRISTNGTVFPGDLLLKSMKNPKVIVFVSGYPETVAPKRKEILQLLAEHKVRIHDLDDQVWYDTGSCSERKISDSDLQKMIRDCAMANSKALYKDYFYLCSRCANGERLGYFTEMSKVRLRGDTVNVREQLKKMYELNTCTGCRHCDSVNQNGIPIPPAEQYQEKT